MKLFIALFLAILIVFGCTEPQKQPVVGDFPEDVPDEVLQETADTGISGDLNEVNVPEEQTIESTGNECVEDSECAALDADCCGCVKIPMRKSLDGNVGQAFRDALQCDQLKVLCQSENTVNPSCDTGATARCLNGVCRIVGSDGAVRT